MSDDKPKVRLMSRDGLVPIKEVEVEVEKSYVPPDAFVYDDIVYLSESYPNAANWDGENVPAYRLVVTGTLAKASKDKK